MIKAIFHRDEHGDIVSFELTGDADAGKTRSGYGLRCCFSCSYECGLAGVKPCVSSRMSLQR